MVKHNRDSFGISGGEEADQAKAPDPLTKALESLREEDNTMGDTREPAPEDYNWQLHEKCNELERQIATLTTELARRDKYIESLTEQLRHHFAVIKDLASAMTTR